MTRPPGLSARLKLTLSYAAVVLVTGAVLIVVVWMYLLRYVPNSPQGLLGISPNQFLLSRIFGRAAAQLTYWSYQVADAARELRSR